MSFLLSEGDTTAALSDLRLPTQPDLHDRAPLPVTAAIVPVVGALGMYAFTGSVFMLWFAVLGPLMLIASMVDRKRGRRRELRRYRKALSDALAHAEHTIAEVHSAERIRRCLTYPALQQFGLAPDAIWRAHPGREDGVRIGTGDVQLGVEVFRGDPREEATLLASSAKRLEASPVVLPLDGGICVRGDLHLARSVARALLLQLCLTHPPGGLAVGRSDPEEEWINLLPHTKRDASRRVVLTGDHTWRGASGTDVPVLFVAQGCEVPPMCTTVVELAERLHAVIARGRLRRRVEVEASSQSQAAQLARLMQRRAISIEPLVDNPVALSALARRGSGALSAAIGLSDGSIAELDLVADGPHAVVVGTTGAGKSEFLVSWILAMCAGRSTDAVQVMLADFKGGTAFLPLAELPHVVGVLTDLDGNLARRAVSSLAAEVKRRERVLAEGGFRDVSDARVPLSRLVVVVDEYPALIAQHADLEHVFTDIAARGRALGIHVIIGAQRAVGSIRDATLANCPLRVALRTAESADSRMLIGTDDAMHISGGAEGRGIGYIRRAGDSRPYRTRIALSSPNDITACVHGAPVSLRPVHTPWLAPLGTHIIAADEESVLGVPLGRSDVPELQAQPTVLLRLGERGLSVLGAPRSGKSTVLAAIAQRVPDAVIVPSHPEAAWDVVSDITRDAPALVLCDDVDVLLSRFEEPWASEMATRLERVFRAASQTDTTIVCSAQRISGAVHRLVELLPRRAILAMPSRIEHVSAGGDPQQFAAQRPAGRGVLDGCETQFYLPPTEAALGNGDAPPVLPWEPGPLSGVVTRRSYEELAIWCGRYGYRVQEVSSAHAPEATDPATVLVGDPDQWQRAFTALDLIRRKGSLMIGVDCGSEVRLLTGLREHAPYATGIDRAWLWRQGRALQRVRWGN